MSTSPIGTRVPTLAPNAIIRAGIPLSDNFNATDVAVSLGSLLDSGAYTPTISGETNGIIVIVNSATYIKVGNIVTVSAQLDIQLDAGESDGSFEMSLPVASNFTSGKNLFGLMQYSYGPGTLAEITQLEIGAEVTNNTCFVYLLVATPTLNMSYCTIQFQYEVI
jgi:hypothetical protein